MKLEKILFNQIKEHHIKFLLKKEKIENGDDGLKIIFRLKSKEITIGEKLLIISYKKDCTSQSFLNNYS
jgi:hypothetical protein